MIRLLPKEFLLYTAASACAFAVDVLGLLALTSWVHIQYLVAATISFTAGTCVAYLLCLKFVFRFRRLARVESEFTLFWTIGLIGLVINGLIIALGVEIVEVHLLVAKIVASACTLITNYTLRKFLLFMPARATAAQTESENAHP